MNYLAKYSDEELFSIFDSNIEEEIRSRGYEFGWHKKVPYAGDIYILVNPAFPNLVKIGYTKDVIKRLKSLNSSSGLPDPFHVYATYKVKKPLEDLKLHGLIDSLDSDLRHSKNREFYEMTPEKAYEILSAIAQINGDEDLLSINPLDDKYFYPNDLIRASDASSDESHKSKTYYLRRKNMLWGHLVEATVIHEGKKWIVQPGSIVCPVEKTEQLNNQIKKQRKAAIIVDNILQQEVIFHSPSAAASFAFGGGIYGGFNLQTEDGTRLKDIQRQGC